MHIALSINNKSFGAVAFDFDKVLEPHEHLQRDMLICNGGEADVPRLCDWIGRNIGKRAYVWANDPLNTLPATYVWFADRGLRTPWGAHQWGDIHTLTWAAQHVLGSEFHVPSVELAGLESLRHPLHEASMTATLIQSALRALILHERRHGPGKVTYPK